MTLHCKLGCGDVPGTTEHDWIVHYRILHLGVTEESRTAEQWETAAEHLIREAARTGEPFTVAAALASLGDHPDPNKRSSFNGRLTRRLAAAGVLVKVGATESVKESTARSLVHEWRGPKPARSDAA